MAIEIEEYVAQCREKIDQKTLVALAVGGRKPERPVTVTFLGNHAEEGKNRFLRALKGGWPTASHSIQDRIVSYETPEAFTKAIEAEDAEGTHEVDRMILRATNDYGMQVRDVLMVYFVNFNDENVDTYIELLDQPYTTPMGGQKERMIFAIGKSTTNKAARQMTEFAEKLMKVANNEDSRAYALWSRTSCMMLSNYMCAGGTLSDDIREENNFMQNYALAMDILMMQYSMAVPEDAYTKVSTLPRLNGTYAGFLTASLQRESKPVDQMARAALYTYFNRGAELAQASGATVSNAILKQQSQKAMNDLFTQLIRSKVFPADNSIVHLPNNAKTGEDIGMGSGPDKTLGCWSAFSKLHFTDPIEDRFSNPKVLRDYFARFFSRDCGYSCGDIMTHFPAFHVELAQMQAAQLFNNGVPKPADPAYKWGLYAAWKRLEELCFAGLKDAVSSLSRAAGDYTRVMTELAGQVLPYDTTVLDRYKYVAGKSFTKEINGDTVEDQLKRPCDSTELESRLKDYIDLVTNEQDMLTDFFSELRTRLADGGANLLISNFLNRPSHELEREARMHVGVPELLGEATLVDAGQLNVGCPNLFMMRGTNGMDRVVIYRFTIHDILTEVAG